ncbi:hypothetical protein EMPS_11573 [Entomortierella parvispora]|uniref:Uncharacterized protein n=1 Tax=Entomortierella parvispora TaxID=205924 RepID=A0A9P3HMV4_9FUNG|nr:hypothetical protein EMPS_11573 [Entomortierella parvispora]
MRFGADSAAAALCRGCPRLTTDGRSCGPSFKPMQTDCSKLVCFAPSGRLPPTSPGLGARGGFSSPIHSPLVSRGNGAREATRHQLSH